MHTNCFKMYQDGTQPFIRDAHALITVCSRHTVPGEMRVVHGEALCDALVPDPRRIST